MEEILDFLNIKEVDLINSLLRISFRVKNRLRKQKEYISEKIIKKIRTNNIAVF